MVSLSLYAQFETNLMSNRKVIELLLQLMSSKAHGKNYIKVKPHLVRHLLRDRLLYFVHLLRVHFIFPRHFFTLKGVIDDVIKLLRSLKILGLFRHALYGYGLLHRNCPKYDHRNKLERQLIIPLKEV